MALKVWLPLSGDITTNYGLGDPVVSADSTADPAPNLIYGHGILGGKSLGLGSSGAAVVLDIKQEYTTAPSKFTISFWVKEGTNSAGAELFTVQRGTTVSFSCVKTADGYEVQGLASGTLFTLANGWNHVAITADGTTVKSYVNGVLSESKSQTGSIVVASNKFDIIFGGKNTGDPVNSWSGYLDSVKFYDSVLSLFEVVAEANALVLHYSFNGKVSLGTGVTLPAGVTAAMMGFGDKEHDLSGNEYDGTFGEIKPASSTDTAMNSASYDFTGAGNITSPTVVTTEFNSRYSVSVWAKGTGTIATFSNGGSIAGAGADKWHNIVVLSNGKKYVDGVEDGTVSGLIGTGNCTITIGGSFTGKLSDFRIYAKEFSEEEIVALFKRRAAVDNTGKLIASEFVVTDDTDTPSFGKTGIVSAAAMASWSGTYDDAKDEYTGVTDVSTFSVLQASSAINAVDVIEF